MRASSGAIGFTLTELLGAMAIAFILSALALGAWRRVLDDSRAAACATNLRKLAQAGLAYAAENNGSLPDRGRWVFPSDKGGGSLGPYLGLPETAGIGDFDSAPGYAQRMICPAVLASAEYRPASGARSYSINQYATGSDNSSDSSRSTWESQVQARNPPLKLSGVKSPASQAFFMDGTCVPTDDGVRYSSFQAPDRLAAADGSGSWRTVYPHHDRINVVFLDGHGERLSQEQAEEGLIGPTNPNPSQAHTSPRTKPFWGATK